MNYGVWNNIVPASAGDDIASTSSSFIAGMSPIVTLLGGILIGFLVIEGIIQIVKK